MTLDKRRSELLSFTLIVTTLVLPIMMFGSVLVDVVRDSRLLAPDFAMFHTAASLANDGRWDEVYDLVAFRDAYEAATGTTADVGGPTYGYPPLLAQLLQPLAAWFSIGIGALVFLATTLGGSLWALGRLGLSWRGAVLLVFSYPAMLVTWLGQNSFLSLVILVGTALLFIDGRKLGAGLVLGLLVFKPQMLAAVGLMFVLAPRRHMRVILGAVASGVAAVLASVAVSLEAWTRFPGGLRQLVEASGNGFRISRVSAIDFSFLIMGDDSRGALALALGLAAAGVWAFIAARRLIGGEPEMELALGLLLACWVNPWMFVYEWVILVIPAVIFFKRGWLAGLRGSILFFALGISAALTGYFSSEQVRADGTAFQLAVPVFVIVVVLALIPAFRAAAEPAT